MARRLSQVLGRSAVRRAREVQEAMTPISPGISWAATTRVQCWASECGLFIKEIGMRGIYMHEYLGLRREVYKVQVVVASLKRYPKPASG